MNLQNIADSFNTPTCIMSVEKTDGGYGAIRIAAANKAYIASIERPYYQTAPDIPGVPEILMNTIKFVPNTRYEEYFPKDFGFEDICYRSAVKKLPIHTYIHMNELELWFDIFCLPLESDDDSLGYCVYAVQPSDSDSVGLSSGQSGTASEDVIKTCIKLHGTDDFTKTMEDVIGDIRLICRAEVCTIVTTDPETGSYSVMATSFDRKSKVKHFSQFGDYGDIAASWLGMFGGSDCLIIRNEEDLDFIRRVNYKWYMTLVEAGVNSLVLFPLKYSNEVLGFVWATNFDTSNTMRIKETLELTTFFISSKLSSYRMLEHLKKISYSDQLTGIPNRLACTELVSGLIKYGECFAVVSIDINNFKSINDTMGFDTGNKVLIEIASRFRTVAETRLAGTQDNIARMNGDEFALVIRDYRSDEELHETILRYESVLGSRLTIDGCDFYITASFGYAVFPDDAATSDSLFSYANASMNEVKRIRSSNHIMRFTPDLLKAERTLEIERKLRTALDEDTVFYHLQPQFDMSHRLRGFEALARMRDHEGNMISPGEFIPVAEKVGLVDKVDGAVFKKSAIFIGDIVRRTGADITLSVNISVRHLMKNDFLEEVKETLRVSGLPAEKLEIEITESIMIDSAEKALRCINEIHEMGIKLAIDDFGTGYSSLSYLNNFPANLLKIDKSFIDKMNTGASSKQYVAAIISIGHIMGYDVISEGVEEQEQFETLREIGCDFIQGYIWGRPLPCGEAEKLILGHIGD